MGRTVGASGAPVATMTCLPDARLAAVCLVCPSTSGYVWVRLFCLSLGRIVVRGAAMTGSGGGQLVKPVLDERVGIEYSVHRPSPAFLRELCLVFPGVDMATILVIPTMQRAKGDLVADSPNAAEEKDRLLEVFCEWATCVCDYIKEHGAWADFTDPCSGFPVRHDPVLRTCC